MSKSPLIILPGDLTETEDRIHGSTHGLKDEWLSSRLLAWFMLESGSLCWTCTLRTDGTWRYWTKVIGQAEPDTYKRDYARKVVAYLNKNLSFEGAWLGAWMDTGWNRFYLLWKDRDGDIQFPIDTAGEITWAELQTWSMEDWGNHVSNAHAIWVDTVKTIDAQPDQQLMLAQGQTRH